MDRSHARTIRRPRLYALTGLKVIAVVAVFFWHALPQDHLLDLGARGCELMFAASGFLVAYNRHGWFTSSIGDAVRYLESKVRKFYPLYLAALIVAIPVIALEGHLAWGDPGTYLSLPFHLAMMQAWSHRIALGFNAPGWFLSALMVCYAAAPVLAQVIKRLTRMLGPRRGVLCVFGTLLCLRLYLELCHAADPGLFKFSLHTNPVVRLTEFGMAYALGVIFVRREDAGTLHVAPAADLLACGAFALCAVIGDRILPRVAFVLLTLPVVYTLAAQTGPAGRLLASKPFQRASSLEMQFYLLHWDAIHLVGWALMVLGITSLAVAVAASLALSVLASVAARRFFPGVRPT